jgi:hypothetical protein
MYGDNAQYLPDEDVREFIANDGYIMAMHILRNHGDFAREQSEMILDLLSAYTGDDLTGYFSSLMHEWTDDPGVFTNPGGYLFQQNDMVPEFCEGARALEIGEFSDIIESQFGYHIILRVPIDYDAVPSRMRQLNRTLRQAVALHLFEANLDSWVDSFDVTFTPELESLDLMELFGTPNQDDE